jgi:ATP-binding cassette subfamily F protein 1
MDSITYTSISLNADAIAIKGLDLAVGGASLLRNTDITIARGDRIALLGRNGCGKSSLFRWLGEQQTPWSIYEVVQELPATNETAIATVLAAHIERGQLWARQAELEAKEELTEAETAEYEQIGDVLASMNASADEARARRILHGLGFSATDMERPLREFSGGWRARIALAQGLFMEPELLLLDEPTNHLDLDGVIWLTNFLQSWRKTLIVISHNTGFVREVASAVWLISEGRVETYRCSYQRYLKERTQAVAKRERDWDALEKQVAALKRKNTPASKKEADELMARSVRPPKPYRPKFLFGDGDGDGDCGPLLACSDTAIGYQEKTILHDVTFALHGGCRVALVGGNGSGKSTLLKFLTAADGVVATGHISRRPGLRVRTFNQHFYHELPADQTPLDYVTANAYVDPETNRIVVSARQVLGASGLEGTAHTRRIDTLSGGQKARVYMAGLIAALPDILLLDEPTNHLDAETIEGLVTGLQEFGGAAVIVSHDVDFLEEVATEVWVARDGGVQRLSEGTDGLDYYVQEVLARLEV